MFLRNAILEGFLSSSRTYCVQYYSVNVVPDTRFSGPLFIITLSRKVEEKLHGRDQYQVG